MTAKSKKLRIGLVGAGMIGQTAHLANFVENTACNVTAIAELRPALGARAAKRFGVSHVFGNHIELIESHLVDAVCVVTRRPATGPIVLDAFRAGLSVLSEKPMAHTVGQAETLVAAAENAACTYAVGYMKRYDAGVEWARDQFLAYLQDGALGTLISARIWNYGGQFAPNLSGFDMTTEVRPEGLELWPIAPDWVPTERHEEYAGFANVYIHDVNLIRYFLGDDIQVAHVRIGRANSRHVIFEAGTVPVYLEMGEQDGTRWREGMELTFEKGDLTINLPEPMDHSRGAEVILRRAGADPVQRTSEGWAFKRQADAFVEDVLGRRNPLASGRDSLGDLALIEQVWRLGQ